MHTYWQLKEGQGAIEMDAFSVPQEPIITRICNFFRKLSYGEILDQAEIEQPTQKEFRRKLKRNKLKTTCLDVFLMRNYAEIDIIDKNFKRCFTMKFIPTKYFHLMGERDTSSSETVYAETASNLISRAIDTIDFLCNVLKCSIRTMNIENDIFMTQEANGSDIAKHLLTLKKCENLFIHGNHTVCPAVEELVLRMQVLRRMYVRDTIIDNVCNYRKLSTIPSTEFVMSRATPRMILDSASITSQFSIQHFTMENFNELILLWMSSTSTRIRRLVLKVPGTSREDIEKLFAGMEVVPGLIPVCGFRRRCGLPGCIHHKLRFFFETGIEFHRADGAKATVFYSDVSPLFTLAMAIDYPNTKNINLATS